MVFNWAELFFNNFIHLDTFFTFSEPCLPSTAQKSLYQQTMNKRFIIMIFQIEMTPKWNNMIIILAVYKYKSDQLLLLTYFTKYIKQILLIIFYVFFIIYKASWSNCCVLICLMYTIIQKRQDTRSQQSAVWY